MSDYGSLPVRIDRKGKYYTKIVSTSRLVVQIHLRSGEDVFGSMHLRSGTRLSDELNDDKVIFLSITNAAVKRGEDLLYETSYIALNRAAIEWVVPQQAIGEVLEESEDEQDVS